MSHRVKESQMLAKNGPAVKIKNPRSHGLMKSHPVSSLRFMFCRVQDQCHERFVHKLRRSKRSNYLLICSLAVLQACQSQSRFPTETTFENAEAKASEAVGHDLARPSVGARGAIVQVSQFGKKWIWSCGTADDPGTSMRPDMRFRIASITKLFTSAAVLRLIDQGKLSPSDRVDKYLPNPNPTNVKDWDKITVLQLANNTSGLNPGSTAAGSFAHWNIKDLLPLITEEWPPGKQFHYANMNFVVLGALVEKISHLSFAQFMAKEFFKPLGLRNTLEPSSGSDPQLVCRGFDGDRDVTEEEPSWASAAGDMVSTVSDLTTFIRALGSGKLFSPGSQKILTTITAPARATGFGIERFGDWIGHTGRIEGYSSACFYNPKIDAAIVVMVNRKDYDDGNTNSVARELPVLYDVADAFFHNQPLRVTAD
jgi:D-alanyl-D-alanine carboxypeptidase